MRLTTAIQALQATLGVADPSGQLRTCSTGAFSQPDVFGASNIRITAEQVLNYTRFSLRPGNSSPVSPVISFCNVTVTYGHAGWNDNIHVSVWLPLNDWNGRLQALGGGGYSATFGPLYQTQAVGAGYVAIGTDAGLGGGMEIAQDPSAWALTSPGNVNLYLLENYGSRSLNEMTIIGKAITREFYGTEPRYSYFSGCSGGGRQGLMIAQRYSDSYDGILAVAPAINIESFIPAGYWASQVMHDIGYYPPPCEVDAFTQEALAACDGLDGVKDGVISSPQSCKFKAHDVVGKSFNCTNKTLKLTSSGATVVQAAWDGAHSDHSRFGWFGLNPDASLTTAYISTQCANGSVSNCTISSSALLSSWFKFFLAKDTSWNSSSMTSQQFFDYLRQSKQEYYSMLSSSSPDLSPFRAAGGKMITWHGIADEVIPPNGTIAYYQQVLGLDPKARDFYRHFEAPGVGHCHAGAGPSPNNDFEALVRWVEEGVAPDVLLAGAQGSKTGVRPLCPYPQRQRFTGRNDTGTFFECAAVALQEDGDIAAQFPFYNST